MYILIDSRPVHRFVTETYCVVHRSLINRLCVLCVPRLSRLPIEQSTVALYTIVALRVYSKHDFKQ